MIRVDDARVYESLAAPLGDTDVLDLSNVAPAIVGAVSDVREIGGEDVEDEDDERAGRLAFAIEKEGATA